MKRHTQNTTQKGYTLVELLLYIAILGFLLTSITYFLGPIVDSRTKNQTISEVDQQGAAVMDYMTQTIRNATAITSPAAGASGSSLTLTVPTGSLSPTVFDAGTSSLLGVHADGGTTDGNDSNSINATQFTASATGTISTLYGLVGATIGTSPNNVAQMAIYSGASSPTTLLASSASVALTASSWVAFPISSVTVTSGQKYWLAYNTNGTAGTQNNLRYGSGSTNQTQFVVSTYGTWPGSWTGTGDNVQNSMYANIVAGGTLGATTDGGSTDTGDNNTMSATKVVAPATGTISTLYTLVGPSIDASPNNKAQMAIYSGGSSPTTLLASSSAATLVASTWIAFPISPVTVTSGQTYWLVYNNNGIVSADNGYRHATGSAGQNISVAQTYGAWPGTWSGGVLSTDLSSMYGTIVGSGGTATPLEVTEGAGSPVSLINSRMLISGLTFTNLTAAGTSGIVQVSFTLSELNPNAKNVYDYQKTFTSSSEIGW